MTGSDWVDVELTEPLGEREMVHAPIEPAFSDLVRVVAAPPDHWLYGPLFGLATLFDALSRDPIRD